MFSFSLGSGGTPTSIDPDEERKPPPEPTLIYFPQNDVELHSSENWFNNRPDLFAKFGPLTKPADIRRSHLECLNITTENDVPLEDFVPGNPAGPSFLPPKQWTQNLDPNARRTSVASTAVSDGADRHFMLSNGYKAPDVGIFTKHCRELACSTEDGLRAIGQRKPRKGHLAPHLVHYRDFWQKLELVSQYYDTEHDHYYQVDSESAAASRTNSPTASPKAALKRLSIFSHDKSHNHHHDKKPDSGRRYKGFRKSNGSKMPEHFRIDMCRMFLRNIIMAFHCSMQIPRAAPKLEIDKLCIPVTQNTIVYRLPEDKKAMQRGIVEGPAIGLQCRNETLFARSDELATLDVARELAGIFMLAQERAREGKPRRIPGEGKWYTTKPRWGGGPGGEFGEAEGNTDAHPTMVLVKNGPGHHPRKMTEEQIWKELKPGEGLWDWRTTYLSIGKDRSTPQDSVFMVSSIFSHISILRLDVDPLFLDYMVTGITPDKHHSSAGPGRTWDEPKLYRTRWFDMLKAEDRVECFRGIWGVFSYLMRSDQLPNRPSAARQASEVGPLFGMLKNTANLDGSDLSHQRSRSVAF